MGYIAAASAVLMATLAFALTGHTEGTPVDDVSSSHVTVRRTGVSPNRYAEGSTTASASTSAATAATTARAAHSDTDFVPVKEYIPDIEVDLAYATDRNFTGKVIYGFSDAWLRYGTVKKLGTAQEELKKHGLRIKIWDAFRPVEAQFRLWEICPVSTYVSNPHKGYSSHSRGGTVDVTLVDAEGNEVAMPTGFDDFSKLADRNYSDVKDKAAVANAKLLEKTMKKCGFVPYSGEWWHFSDSVRYNVAKDFIPE